MDSRPPASEAGAQRAAATTLCGSCRTATHIAAPMRAYVPLLVWYNITLPRYGFLGERRNKPWP